MGEGYYRDGQSLARLAAFPEQNPSPVLELDPGGLVYANPTALVRFPELPEAGEGHGLISASRRIAARIGEDGSRSGSEEVEIGDACYELYVSPVPDTGSLHVYATDVTGRSEARRLLAESEWRFWQLFDRSSEAIFLHDTQGHVVDCNAEACSSLGYTREELLSLSVEDFAVDVLSREQRWSDEAPWRRALHLGPGAQVSFHENEHRRKDGSTFPVEVGIGAVDYGNERLVLASARDISEHKLLEAEVARRASCDPATGLPNREALDAGLARALPEARRRNEKLAVMFLYLGGLGGARERLGYRAGDELLNATARRVRGCLGAEDTVYRPGGDGLAVLVESTADTGQAIQTALDILQELQAPLADGEFQAEATIGVALFPAKTNGSESSGGSKGSEVDLEEAPENPLDAAYRAMRRARLRGEPYEVSY